MSKIQVIHPEAHEPKKGLNAKPIFETETDQVSEVRISGGTTGGWHHHGKRKMYGYVVSGKADLEFGKNGKERATISAGDFFLIPPGTVHRDVNPNQEEAFILIFNIGEGSGTQEVSGPDS